MDTEEVIAAGREATERYSWTEAYELFRRADADSELTPSDLEDLARSAWWTGNPEECIDAKERAYAGYINAGEPQRAAMVAISLADDNFHVAGVAVGKGWLNRAARLLEGEPDSPERGYLLRTQAVVAFEADNDIEMGLDLARRSYEFGERFGNADLQALGLHDQGRMMVAAGDVDEGMALMDEAMIAAVGGELGALTTGRVYCNMIDTCEKLADYRRAADWSDAALRWCERAGHSSGFPGVCRIHRAEIMRLRGDWAEAEEEARLASDELGNFPDFAGEAFYEIGEIRLHVGDLEGAEEAFRLAHGSGRDPQPGLALLRLAQGDQQGASALIGQTPGDDSLSPLQRARLLPAQVEIAIAIGDIDGARAATRELESIADAYGSPALIAQAAQATGRLQLVTGAGDAAIESLQGAAQLWRENDLPYEEARARALLSAAYLDQGVTELAQLELETARRSFERLGAMRDLRATIEAARNDLLPQSADRVEGALMFTDMVDSTKLIGVIGDSAWEHLVRWHHRTLRSLFASHGGREIDQAGDGFFVTFETAQAAAECAIDIQRTLAEHRSGAGFAPEIRIGLHAGEVTEVGGHVAGSEVHKAARISSQAEGGQIAASTVVADQLSVPTSSPRLVQLKGFEEGVEVVDIEWQ